MDELVAPSTPSSAPPPASNNSGVSMDLLSSYSQLQSQGKSDAAAAAAAHASSNGMTAVDPPSPLDMYGSSWDVSR
ncbi:hypothetical protein SJAG_02966 [Schizosaccharomyces japonicus yFS275]|uniref:Uncharacterized protein n=1 Tax=Schizosaccharomyces japonicus (strain yFS275 / FY16936) TaxID=402676 RepID=B6K2Y9_SCHJY|nr:hypothetical protein SJAG_02966 [Schizosaccharomyces japonicus yFS275]EEB07846.1 hypothetical protein SJAG_02966 [Schizosaccharomyces japonicus yFS275]